MAGMANPYRKPEPNDTKRKYVEYKILGMSNAQAAKKAGGHHHQLAIDPWVVRELELHEDELRKERSITKEKVTGIVMEAVDIARIKAEAGDMIRGAQELNKMYGHYEPDRKEVIMSGEVEVKHAHYAALSDAELLEMCGEERPAIEAEFERLTNETDETDQSDASDEVE